MNWDVVEGLPGLEFLVRCTLPALGTWWSSTSSDQGWSTAPRGDDHL